MTDDGTQMTEKIGSRAATLISVFSPRLQSSGTSLSDDHSELVPLLPIPNRTVKRLSADDIVDYPCESRSSSDSLKQITPSISRALLFQRILTNRQATPTMRSVFDARSRMGR